MSDQLNKVYFYRPQQCTRFAKYVVIDGNQIILNVRKKDAQKIDPKIRERLKLAECQFIGQGTKDNVSVQLWQRLDDDRAFLIEDVEGFTLVYTSVYRLGEFNYLSRITI